MRIRCGPQQHEVSWLDEARTRTVRLANGVHGVARVPSPRAAGSGLKLAGVRTNGAQAVVPAVALLFRPNQRRLLQACTWRLPKHSWNDCTKPAIGSEEQQRPLSFPHDANHQGTTAIAKWPSDNTSFSLCTTSSDWPWMKPRQRSEDCSGADLSQDKLFSFMSGQEKP